jgi:hypothetical protein
MAGKIRRYIEFHRFIAQNQNLPKPPHVRNIDTGAKYQHSPKTWCHFSHKQLWHLPSCPIAISGGLPRNLASKLIKSHCLPIKIRREIFFFDENLDFLTFASHSWHLHRHEWFQRWDAFNLSWIIWEWSMPSSEIASEVPKMWAENAKTHNNGCLFDKMHSGDQRSPGNELGLRMGQRYDKKELWPVISCRRQDLVNSYAAWSELRSTLQMRANTVQSSLRFWTNSHIPCCQASVS